MINYQNNCLTCKPWREDKEGIKLEIFCKICHMYIYCIISFYKQMYIKDIINMVGLLIGRWGTACLRCFLMSSHTSSIFLGGVFVLLCTAASKIHPPQVVPVLYPVAGAKSTGFAIHRGVPTHRTLEVERQRDRVQDRQRETKRDRERKRQKGGQA